MSSTTISSNGFSVDQQAADAMSYLERQHPEAWDKVIAQFPEYIDHTFCGSWFDTEEMRVDVEWGSWLVDAIEGTGYVFWEEGEPWAEVD